jgi:chitodextrinase
VKQVRPVYEPLFIKKLVPAWMSRIIDMFIILMIGIIALLPARLEAAMQSDSYLIYDSVMYSFDGPVISGVSCAAEEEAIAVSWNTDVVSDAFVVYDTDSSMLSTHEQGLSAKTGTAHSVTVSGLLPATTYYYRVRSTRTNGGVTTDSTVRSCVSGGAAVVPPAPAPESAPSGGGGVLIIDKTDKNAPVISNLQISETTSDSALITWETDEEATSFVEFGTSTAYGSTFGGWTSSKTHGVRLEHLKSDTAYHIRALSSDSWGNPGRSDDRMFMTAPPEKDEEETPEDEKPDEEKPEDGEDVTILPGKFDLTVENIIKLINELAGKSTLTELQRQLLLEYEALRNISQNVPSPLFRGDPKVEVQTDRAVITWETDRDANSIVALAAEEDYRPRANEPYRRLIGDSETYVRSHRVEIFGLEPDSVYHFQVRSKASIGPYARTRDLVFRTKAESLTISNYYAQVIDNKTAQFKWVTNADADSVVRITPYRGNTLSVDESKIIKDGAMTAVHVMTVSEFAEGMKYEIELSSHDAQGRSASANIPLFSTSDTDHAPEISRIQTNSTIFLDKGNKIQTIITWQTSEPATSQIFYREGVMDIATDTAEKTDLVADYSREHVMVVTKFKPGTVYSFRVESIDSGGNEVLSEVHTFMTPKKRESILDMIIRILEDMFGWVRNIY